MTVLLSVLGFAGRVAGDLLTSALGWASSLLFGRVPRTHQVFLVLMMAGSFLWLVMLLALLVPTVASTLLAATPHPPFVNRTWLGAALLVSVIFLPLGMGLAGYLVPSEEERPRGAAVLRELLRGYLLAPLVGGLLLFLAGVGIARKARSQRHRWSDVHVPIVVKPDGYDRMVVDLHDALARVGLDTRVEDAPWVLTVPGQLLTRVAGPNVRRLRADRLKTLMGDDLNVGIYPSDIAISGATDERLRARAAIQSRLATSSAHLTMSAEGQAVEDELARLGTSRPAHAGRLAPSIRASFDAVDETLLALAVPTDEWDTLYRLRLQVERDLLVGEEPGTAGPGSATPAPAFAPSATRSAAAREPAGAGVDAPPVPLAPARG